ncbi:MAG: cytochrome P460 family protein [Candidatus Rokubacteria bacterium]|nr:cytochrome P460 family protein [Candidatus Rokubacteria bacterium]
MRRLSGLWLLLMTLAVPAAAQLPDDLAGYERWKVLRAGGLPTEGPHPGTKTVYVNPVGATAKPPFPAGTVIVKSGVKDGFVHLVALMRKLKGQYREADGWYFEEYLRARPTEPFRLAFGGPSGQALCVACHLGPRDADFVYSLKR